MGVGDLRAIGLMKRIQVISILYKDLTVGETQKSLLESASTSLATF